MKLLAIDPSIHNVGMAFCDTEKKESIKTHMHHLNVNFKDPTQKMSLISSNIFAHVKAFIGPTTKIDRLVIEYPNWQPSTKGKIAAQKGYTLDLAFIAGFIAGEMSLFPWNIYLPIPTEWKGNVPKKVTQHRVEKQFGMLQISEHEFDAIGLLMWLMKKLKLDFPSKIE